MSTRRSLPAGLVRAMRPHQWSKNVLVFAAPVAAGRILERDVFVDTVLAFVAFCAASAATYLLNDARDVEADRAHPTKRNRPIAAGIVPIPVAIVAAAVLLVGGVALAVVVSRDFTLTLIAYLVLTTAYNLGVKHIPVYDIVAVAAGFVLRAIGGGTATGVPISEWFFIVASFGALLMVSGKREGELMDLGEKASSVRSTLGEYGANYLTYVRSVSSGVMLVAYTLWAFETADRPDLSPDGAFWFRISILPFTIAILRYALLLDRGEGAEPERLVFSDRPLLVAAACWAMIYGYGVYVA